MANAIAEPDLLEKIAQFELAHLIAMDEDDVKTSHVFARKDGLVLIVLSSLVPLNAQEMVIATTEHASASLVSLVFTAHCQLAHPLAQETENAELTDPK